jgi:hypothetical protein
VYGLAIGEDELSQAQPKIASQIMAGKINTTNFVTIVSVAILVGTEIIGAALALGWALGGVFELPELWRQGLIAIFLAGGAYATYRFFRHAATVEPVFNK